MMEEWRPFVLAWKVEPVVATQMRLEGGVEARGVAFHEVVRIRVRTRNES
jgi:hypothetical protein